MKNAGRFILVISSFVARNINLPKKNPNANFRGGQLRIFSYSSEEIRVITYNAIFQNSPSPFTELEPIVDRAATRYHYVAK